MLTRIRIENLRGLCLDVELGPYVRLSGRNGTGKSAIKEAIAFLFTGRDSLGTQKPTHLISTGCNTLLVEGRTSKGALLTRTLMQKGGGSLKMVQGETTRTLTQSDFERMLCGAETFLAAFVPGYLMSLKKDRQLAVLTEILPPMDRRKLLSDLSLIPVADLPELDLSKRADIVADDLALKRRALGRELATLEGQISAYSVQELTNLTAPTPPPELAEKALLDSRRAAQARYAVDKAHYDTALATHDRMVHENKMRRAERERVERELESLTLAPMPVDTGEVVMEAPPIPPAAPSVQAVMESERCSACGQTVGMKHRESMRAQNKAEMEKFEKVQASHRAELAEFEKRQRWRQENREKGQQEIRRIGALNREIEKRRAALERHWHHNEERAVMALPPEPQKPTEEYSEKRHNDVIEAVEGFRRSVVAYEYAVQKAQEMTARAQDLVPQRHALMDRIEFSSKIETALGELPRRELEIHAEHLAMPHGYTLTTEDGLALTDGRGCPYELLSAGQAMRADVELCMKVSGLMKRPVRMVFLDNADLADWVGSWQAADGYQFYWATVTDDPEVVVKVVVR